MEWLSIAQIIIFINGTRLPKLYVSLDVEISWYLKLPNQLLKIYLQMFRNDEMWRGTAEFIVNLINW